LYELIHPYSVGIVLVKLVYFFNIKVVLPEQVEGTLTYVNDYTQVNVHHYIA